MNAMLETWLDIGALDDIPLRGGRVVRTPRGCVAVFRAAADEVFALDDRCPHKGGPLSDGIVHGRSVTCPLHNWVDQPRDRRRPRARTRARSAPTRCGSRAGRILLGTTALRG